MMLANWLLVLLVFFEGIMAGFYLTLMASDAAIHSTEVTTEKMLICVFTAILAGYGLTTKRGAA